MAERDTSRLSEAGLSDEQIAKLMPMLAPAIPSPVVSEEPPPFDPALDLTNDQIMSGDFGALPEVQEANEALENPPVGEANLPRAPYQDMGGQIDPASLSLINPNPVQEAPVGALAAPAPSLQEMAIQGLEKYHGFRDENLRQKYLLDSELGKKRAQALNAQFKENDRLAAIDAQTMREREELTKKYTEDADALSSEIANAKVDPDKFWGDMSTAGKIFASIAIGISSSDQMARGASGLPPMVELINKQIEQDIKKQKMNYDSKRQALSDRSSAYQRAMAVTGDSLKATDIARQAALKKAQQTMQLEEARQTNPRAKLALQQGKAAIQGELAQGVVKMAQDEQKRLGKMKPMEIPGLPGRVARDEKSLEHMKKITPLFMTTRDTITDMKNKISDMNFIKRFTPSKVREELESMAIALRGNARTDIIGPGAITEKEMDLLREAIPSGTSAWTPIGRKQAINRLNAVMQQVQRRFDNEAKVHMLGQSTPERLKLRKVTK